MFMQLTDREKYWLLKEAWTYLGYDKPNKACTILLYLDNQFKHNLEIKKMLLIALLYSKKYQKALELGDHLLQNTFDKQDKRAIYLCKIDALSNLGQEENAQEIRDLFFMDKNL
jgi:hypothetical protein